MSGDTTYQSLERLTHMPNRTGNQGDRIAGQLYYDVYFTGGSISGVNLVPSALTVTDNTFFIQDNLDNTKRAQFQCSGISAGTVRTYTFPDVDTTVTGTDATQTLTNKTYSGGVIASTITAATAGQILLDDSITTVGANLPLAFDGDADTGLFRSASNVFNAAAGGVSICRFQQGTATGLRMDRAIYLVNGTSIASASSTDLGAATGNTVVISGTTTINNFGTTPPIGSRFTTRFSGVLTLTNSANLINLTGANVITAVGDIAEWHYEAASTWRMLSYSRADGSSLTTSVTNATGILPGANGGTGINNSGKTITLGGNLTTSGAFAATITLTGTTTITAPTTGTLATLAGSEALTNKSVNGVTLTTGGSATSFLNGAGSYATVSNGLVLLATATASNSATIDFTSGIDSTYDEYELHLINVVPSTDAVDFFLRTSANAGSSFDSGGSDYNSLGGGVNSLGYINRSSPLGNNTGECFSAVINIFDPANTTRYKILGINSYHYSAVPDPQALQQTVVRTSTAIVNGIRLYMSSGNIASGKFKLYGVQK